MPKFKEGISRKQRMLFPPSIVEYIPKDHLAKLVLEIVQTLDLSKIESDYSEEGQHAYSPTILLSILFYSYSIGLRSSRKIARACEERVDYMYLSAKTTPSYKTISEFRRKQLDNVKQLFKDIVRIGIELGLVNMGNIKVSIDGTKIRANAASKKTKDEKGLKKLLGEIDKEIDGILSEAETIDREEDEEYGDKRGDELPKELSKLSTRKQKIKEAIEILQKEKEAKRKSITDKKGSLNAEEKKEISNMKINLTDKDAKYMRERQGVTKANYNAQLSVDEENQFILANDISTNASDCNQLIPLVKKTQDNTNGTIKEVKTDSGYHSQDNLEQLEEKVKAGELGKYLIDNPNKKKLNNEKYKFDRINFKYDKENDVYICPKGKILEYFESMKKRGKDTRIYKCNDCDGCKYQRKCTRGRYREIHRRKGAEIVDRNRKKMLQQENWESYKKRMHTVEPVFGNTKFNLGYIQFLLRGKEKVGGEYNLMCIGHDLQKICKAIKKKAVSVSETISIISKTPQLSSV